MEDSETPVLVVGAGPVGLMSGILLAQQGVACRVIERRPGPVRAPAAHVVNARTFEICRAAGVDMAALAGWSLSPADGGDVRFLTSLAGTELGCLPFERQGDDALASTPTPLRNLAQHRFEPVLLEALERAPAARIDYGHELVGFAPDAQGVTARVRDLVSGREANLRSRWLVAADGAGSSVRRTLGIAMAGPARLQRFLMIHFGADLRPWVKDRPGALHWIFSPEASGTFIAHDIDREWVYMHPWNDDDAPRPSGAEAAEIVYRALGTREPALEVLDLSPWTMTAQVASAMRAGRVFLAGDAAHRFPPTGGLGLNSGVQDAHNLAWKLAAVEAGRAGDGLLESYEVERKAIAQDNADQSLRNAVRLAEIPQALALTELADTAELERRLADPEYRAGVDAAIAHQAEHFDMFGLQIGFVYEQGALVPDEKAAARSHDRVRDYQPTSRPGARLPHAWVRAGGERVSVLDLLDPVRFTLIVGPEGGAWAQAPPPGVAVCVVGRDFDDVEGHWQRDGELAPAGALLVRPDQHVAWRAHDLAPDPEETLRSVLATILATPAR